MTFDVENNLTPNTLSKKNLSFFKLVILENSKSGNKRGTFLPTCTKKNARKLLIYNNIGNRVLMKSPE